MSFTSSVAPSCTVGSGVCARPLYVNGPTAPIVNVLASMGNA